MALSSADWPRLLSLAVHELRAPLTATIGYLHLLSQSGEPLSDRHKRLVLQTEKTCARLAALVADLSDLARLEAGTATLNAGTVDLFALVQRTATDLQAGTLPQLVLRGSQDEAPVVADTGRLRAALIAIATSVARGAPGIAIGCRRAVVDGAPVAVVVFGTAAVVDAVSSAAPPAMTAFDEWHGGTGLALPLGRRAIETFGGAIWSCVVGDDRGVVVQLPVVTDTSRTLKSIDSPGSLGGPSSS